MFVMMKFMNVCKHFILPFMILQLLFSCGKGSDVGPQKSSSEYNNAELFIEKEKWVFRNDSQIDSVSQSIMIGAKFGDSARIFAFDDSVDNVSVSGFGLGRPNFWNNAPAPYFFELDNASESSVEQFDNADWIVTAPNNIEDLSYDAGSTAYYQDVMPVTIVRSDGLAIRTNTSAAPNADSITVHIGMIDTTVSTTTDFMLLTPAKLAVLPVVTDRSYFIVIHSIKNRYLTVNGKGFKIRNTRVIRYNVNIY